MSLKGSVDAIAKSLLYHLCDAYGKADQSNDIFMGMQAGQLLQDEGYLNDDDSADLLKVHEAVRLIEEQGFVKVMARLGGTTPHVKPTALGIETVYRARRNPVAKAVSHMWDRQAVPAAVAGGFAGAAFGYLAGFLH